MVRRTEKKLGIQGRKRKVGRLEKKRTIMTKKRQAYDDEEINLTYIFSIDAHGEAAQHFVGIACWRSSWTGNRCKTWRWPYAALELGFVLTYNGG
jgi:hypothetical protein